MKRPSRFFLSLLPSTFLFIVGGHQFLDFFSNDPPCFESPFRLHRFHRISPKSRPFVHIFTASSRPLPPFHLRSPTKSMSRRAAPIASHAFKRFPSVLYHRFFYPGGTRVEIVLVVPRVLLLGAELRTYGQPSESWRVRGVNRPVGDISSLLSFLSAIPRVVAIHLMHTKAEQVPIFIYREPDILYSAWFESSRLDGASFKNRNTRSERLRFSRG